MPDDNFYSGETLPGVYARVSYVVGWIVSNTSSGRSCGKPTATIQEHVTVEKPVPTEKPVPQLSSGFLSKLSMNVIYFPSRLG